MKTSAWWLAGLLLAAVPQLSWGQTPSPQTQTAPPAGEQRFIRVVNPAKGSVWEPGGAKRIDWVSNVKDSVQIDLYKNRAFIGTLVPGLPNRVGDNYWDWTVPENLKRGSDYQIQITSLNDKTFMGSSAPFAVKGAVRTKRFLLILGGGALLATTAAILIPTLRNRNNNLPEPPLPE
jgi:Ser-Thr-rich glycosyl-phosphatidyl-inositol-anchored membrane family